MRHLLLVLGAAVLLASCASQKGIDGQHFEKAPLFGMVYDADNQPCAGVELSVDGGAGPLTDIRGRFVVPDLTRGSHQVVARKAGFEELSVSIEFLSRTDALHLTMTSFDQLLDRARRALAAGEWAEAEEFIARAGRLDPADAVLRYLSAVLAYRKTDYAGAVSALMAILDSGTHEPAVYLFLADIYENNLDDPESAIANLQSYLRLRADPEVEARLKTLLSRKEVN